MDTFGLYENGTKVTGTPEILFARLDAKDVMPKVEAIREAQKKEFEAEQRALGEETPAEEKADRTNADVFSGAVPGQRYI